MVAEATRTATYECPNCRRPLDKGEYCPDCTRKAVLRDTTGTIHTFPGQDLPSRSEEVPPPPPSAPPSPISPPPSPSASPSASPPAESRSTPSAPSSKSEPVPEPPRQSTQRTEKSVRTDGVPPDAFRTVQATTPVPPRPAKVLKIGERDLQERSKEGYRFILLAGIARAGKTEFLSSYEAQKAKQRKGTYLDTIDRKEGEVVPNAPGELKSYPIPDRKTMFVDAAGEDFKELYPHLRRSGKVGEADIGFLRTLVEHLDGLMLLLDLRHLWYPEGSDQQKKERRNQVEILTWVLMLLRWLEHGGHYPESSGEGFVDHVNREVHNLRGKRLSAPVTLLFSRADEALKLKVPLEDDSWLTGTGAERRLFPPGEHPFFFAYHCLGKLFGALHTHASHFRIDFAHSLRVNPAGAVVDKNPMGLYPAVEWMLTPRWQRKLTLPTRHLIAFQKTLDRLTGRGKRWERLPDPVKVKA